MNIRNAILSTASLFEVRPGALDFTQCRVPLDPGSTGCPLAWIGYYLGRKGDSSVVANAFIPRGGIYLTAQSRFFRRMDEITGNCSWVRNPSVCAKSLRYYANMYHTEDVREAA